MNDLWVTYVIKATAHATVKPEKEISFLEPAFLLASAKPRRNSGSGNEIG